MGWKIRLQHSVTRLQERVSERVHANSSSKYRSAHNYDEKSV